MFVPVAAVFTAPLFEGDEMKEEDEFDWEKFEDEADEKAVIE